MWEFYMHIVNYIGGVFFGVVLSEGLKLAWREYRHQREIKAEWAMVRRDLIERGDKAGE
jgi:hypothetical protein